jgi:hypothetical protein
MLLIVVQVQLLQQKMQMLQAQAFSSSVTEGQHPAGAAL